MRKKHSIKSIGPFCFAPCTSLVLESRSSIGYEHGTPTSPKATVITKEFTSPSFTLRQGTRQGFPLSPSLFVIFIEPLAVAIWQNNKIKGIQDAISVHKMCLYADNVLLYLQNSSVSLRETFNIINNLSTILPLSEDAWDSANQDLPLPFQISKIKYLGIHISPRLSELFNLNYSPSQRKIEDDFKRWTKLPLTLLGWIATVKMKTLP